MLKFYIGAPGAGKTLYAVANDILPALAEGRYIVTNVAGIKERIDNISRYLTKHHKALSSKRIKEIDLEIDVLQKSINSLTELEIDDADKKRKEIENLLVFKEFLKNPNYSEEYLLSKIIYLNNENEDVEEPFQKILEGDVVKFVQNHKTEDGKTSKYQNALVVIDEAKKFFSPEVVKKFDDRLKYDYQIFIGEHRHFGFDLIFIDQAFWGTIDKLIRDRTHFVHNFFDSRVFGITGGYYDEVFTNVDSTGTTFSKMFRKTKLNKGKYNKEVFKCYKSQRDGARLVNNFDKKSISWKQNIKVLIPLLILMLVGIFYMGKSVYSDLFVEKKIDNIVNSDSSVSSKEKISSVQKIPPDKKNTNTESVVVEKNVVTSNPVFDLIKNNSSYCTGYFSKSNYDYNFITKLNSKTNKISSKENRNIFVDVNNYNSYSLNSFLIEVYDSSNILIISTNTDTLIFDYDISINFIDNCKLQLKYDDYIVNIYSNSAIVTNSKTESNKN